MTTTTRDSLCLDQTLRPPAPSSHTTREGTGLSEEGQGAATSRYVLVYHCDCEGVGVGRLRSRPIILYLYTPTYLPAQYCLLYLLMYH